MNGGKYEEKTMAPMFCRLHVNDAGKDGPKAPPRNKMALYEQFSIPSQRFKSKVLTPTSTHVSVHERNLPLYVSSSTHTHHAEKFHAGLSDRKKMSTLLTPHEDRKNFGDGDDFTGRDFVQSGIAQDSNSDRLIPPGSEGKGRSSELQNGCHKLRPEVMTKGNDKNHQRQTCSTKIAINLSGEENIDALVEEENESLSQTFEDKRTGSCMKLSERIICSQKNSSNISSLDKRKRGNSVFESGTDKKNFVLQPINDSSSRKNHKDLKEIANESGHAVVRTKGTSQLEDAEKSETVSDTSTVDSVSGFNITPDDVVGVIGQKNFWKARKAIVNQQKVFAVQLFELHRLIKVQQLMAGSPHLLLEDRAPLASSSEFRVKPDTHIADKTMPKKTTHKVECSAENMVGKMTQTSLSSRKTSPGHQWLIPVMSPSEGLVYKLYPAPGVASMPCGSMMNSAYGIPCNPQVDPACTPHYGIPLINPGPSGLAADTISWYPRPVSNSHIQNQSLCNVQAENEGAVWPSTECSPWGGRKDVVSKGRQPLPLFPAAPAIAEPTQVIRVVPHKSRHATKSAARIFQSIQLEKTEPIKTDRIHLFRQTAMPSLSLVKQGNTQKQTMTIDGHDTGFLF